MFKNRLNEFGIDSKQEILSPKKQKNFNKILKVSREIFAKHGYKKASIDMVAKAVNLQKGSLYYYFKSKEDLFVEVIKNEVFSFLEESSHEVFTEKKAKSRLEKYFKLRLDSFRSLKNLYSITEETLQEMLPFTNKLKKAFLEKEKSLIIDILDLGVKNQEFEIENTKFVAIAILASLRGLMPTLIICGDAKFDEQNRAQLLNILFNGICKNKN